VKSERKKFGCIADRGCDLHRSPAFLAWWTDAGLRCAVMGFGDGLRIHVRELMTMGMFVSGRSKIDD
jgi:hypothetical protein